ncbi:DUF4260 domain-containing protein [Flavitalea antarctica]
MKTLLKLEELAMAAISIYFLSLYNLGLPAWIWFLLFFAPDIGMLGYLVNERIGAFSYNLFHHKGIAILVFALGYFMGIEMLVAVGILLYAHASFDRMFGYGLKLNSGFKDTHLGSLEKKTISTEHL